MSMAPSRFETLEGQGMPGVRQLSVFLDNRVGQLLRLSQLLDAERIRILGLSVIPAAEYGVVRIICDNPDEARRVLQAGGFACGGTEVVVVKIPPGQRGLLSVWQCLLSSETNIAYCYPLLPTSLGSALVLAVDNVEIATDALLRNKFEVLSEADLHSDL
ncbi:MAG TPA: acetolactate synthase [Phycisphaerae bacterium]|nr:acetolactate synthase [Phycisphaerae bacterium]HRY69096.1 acetolactate synthase [Phycisphaerae bacterium]HSA29442.1 acetolactate synthase [Phycisphaerae bacterium]